MSANEESSEQESWEFEYVPYVPSDSEGESDLHGGPGQEIGLGLARIDELSDEISTKISSIGGKLAKAGPDEIEISVGIALGAKSKIYLIAEGQASGHFTIVAKWKKGS